MLTQACISMLIASTDIQLPATHSTCDAYFLNSSLLLQGARRIHTGKFRAGQVNLMIVTDVAARGIDIPLLDNVINFDFPAKPKLFVHRAGRAARAGASSAALSLWTALPLPSPWAAVRGLRAFPESLCQMAGRSGTAYSLFSKEELPYLLDLHLFLSRPVQPAPQVPLSQAAAAAQEPRGLTSVYGTFPQVSAAPG